VEIYDRQNRFSAELVYYDNLLKNMFVENELPNDPSGLYVFQYTNVGAISNRGWEFSGQYRMSRRLSIYGSFSIMHSVIKDSTGDYLSFQLAGKAPGYQLKNLPLHTAGLFLNYHFFRLFGKKDRGSINLNITEVDGVYGYDLTRFTIDVAYKRTAEGNGVIPDTYYSSNGTVFRLGLNVEYYLTGQLCLYLQGSNILNQNNPEESSSFPTHGASWLFGFKLAVNH
jgi:outer membrane receptor protein involved in Fe transport